MKRNNYIIAPLLVLVVVGMLVLTSNRRGGPMEVNSGRFEVIGTYGQIQVRCRNRQVGESALAAARKRLDELNALLSTYREDTELSRVNRQAAKTATTVSPLTMDLLARSLYYGKLTGGAFDITVQPLVELWQEAAAENRFPDPCAIAEMLKRTGYKTIELDAGPPPKVRFTQAGLRINVNAIAKGFMIDKAFEELKRPGISGALLEIGGEIACRGENRPGAGWTIGIQDPFAAANDHPLAESPQWAVELTNCSLASSGNYRRYVEIAGRRYSHIVDPRTGYPADMLPSVTIIAPDTTAADALATAVSVMGLEEGLALIEGLPETEAVIIAGNRKGYEVHMTSGMANYGFRELK